MDFLALYRWFEKNRRILPWRKTRDPYAIWISEVMLQQTQVTVVIPYYLKWLERFPTVRALAEAPSDAVIKAWEGLGYYSRARSLHAAAQQILLSSKGIVPSTEEELRAIKGIGPYTSSAILLFAHHKKGAAIDGNVARVLGRYWAIDRDVSTERERAHLRSQLLSILPEEEPWTYNEALIELGALVCQKRPKCTECPLTSTCKAYATGSPEQFPRPRPSQKATYLNRMTALIVHNDSVLVRRVPKGKIMSDLFEFPYLDSAHVCTHEELQNQFSSYFNLTLSLKAVCEPITHTFTRYRVTLYPFLFHALLPESVSEYFWISKHSLDTLSFPSGHRSLARYLQNLS